MNPTPGPWKNLGYSIWADPKHSSGIGNCMNIVASTNTGRPETENEANAQHIVHCVNTHAALVEALEAILPVFDNDGPMKKLRPVYAKDIEKALQALTAAKGAPCS